jgi:hypothetical protein
MYEESTLYMKHLITQAENNHNYTNILVMTIASTHLGTYRRGEEGLIVFVTAQSVKEKTEKRKEGIVLGSVRTHKFFCYTKEVHHLCDAKEGSNHNHTASCTSEEHCRPLVFEKGTVIKSSVCN